MKDKEISELKATIARLQQLKGTDDENLDPDVSVEKRHRVKKRQSFWSLAAVLTPSPSPSHQLIRFEPPPTLSLFIIPYEFLSRP